MRGTRIKIKFKLITWCFYCLLPLVGQAQTSTIDSLEKVLINPIDSTTKLEVLTKLYDHYKDKDLERSLDIVHQIQATAAASNAQKYICDGHYYLGVIHRMMNLEMDTVLMSFNQSLSCCESINDLECKGKALLGKGSVYHRYGLHIEAITFYQKALDIAKERRDTATIIASLGNIGSVLHRRKDYQKSLNYAEEALVYAQAVDHKLFISKITNNIANTYFNQGVYDKALVLYHEALALATEIDSKLSKIIPLANIGGIHVEEKRYEQAEGYLKQAYDLSEEEQYSFGLSLSLRYMSFAASAQDKDEEAIAISRRGLQTLGEERFYHEYTSHFHTVLSNSFKKTGRLDSALVHLEIAQMVKDSIFQLEKEEQIQQLELSAQVKQKEIENKLLKSEQSFTQQKLTSRTYLSIGLIIALFLACGWGFSLYRNIQAKKRANSFLETQVTERTKDLQTANQQLKQANYELKSFNRIASHDLKEPIRNVGNYVGLIFKQLPAETKTKTQDYFDIISKSTSQLYTLLEDIASYSSLSQDETGVYGLVDLEVTVSTIEIGLESLLKAKQGQIVYQGLPQISSNASLIFITLKNLIENGVKFNDSASPKVEVGYQSLVSHHQVVIADNGIGIDPRFQEQVFSMFKRLHSIDQYEGSGIGLAIAKLAVEKLGGSIEVESQVGQGSRFTILLPKEDMGKK